MHAINKSSTRLATFVFGFFVFSLLAFLTLATGTGWAQEKRYTFTMERNYVEWSEIANGALPDFLRAHCNFQDCKLPECVEARALQIGDRRPGRKQKKNSKEEYIAPSDSGRHHWPEYRNFQAGTTNLKMTPWDGGFGLISGAEKNIFVKGSRKPHTAVFANTAPSWMKDPEERKHFEREYRFWVPQGQDSLAYITLVTDDNREILITDQNAPLRRLSPEKKARVELFCNEAWGLLALVHHMMTRGEIPTNPLGIDLQNDSTLVVFDRRVMLTMSGPLAAIYPRWINKWGKRGFVRIETDGRETLYGSIEDANLERNPIIKR